MKSETPGQTGGVSVGQSPTCSHIVGGRTTQWCALGQATGEADAALARIGALLVLGYTLQGNALIPTEHEQAVLFETLMFAREAAGADPTILARARALLAETQEGPDVRR